MPRAARAADWWLAAAALLLSLGLAELAVRLRGEAPLARGRFAYQPELGWTFAPAGSGGSRREQHLAINELGFRDVAHDVAKPAGVQRILVLGDSFTAGTGVGLEETYPRALERLLASDAGTRWEVISLAVNGWGTAQEWIALEEIGLAYSPDVVVLQFFPNDVCNNAIEAAGTCAFNDDVRPYYVERDGELRRTSSQPVRNWLRRRLALYRTVEYAGRSLWVWWKTGGRERSDQLDALRQEQGAAALARLGTNLHPFWYAYARDERQIEAVARGWHMTERLIEAIAGRLRGLGIPLLVVALPNDASVDERAWRELAPRGEDGPLEFLERDYPERRLAGFLEPREVAFLPLLADFAAQRDRVLPYRRYHLDPEGHRVVAEAIREELAALGLAPREPSGASP